MKFRNDLKSRICVELKEHKTCICSNVVKERSNYYCNHPFVSDNFDDYPLWCPFLVVVCEQLSFF